MIYKTPLLSQFGLLGVMGIVFLLVPESVWFLAGKGRLEQAKNNLTLVFGNVKGYDVDHELQVIVNTLNEEKRLNDSFNEQTLIQRYMDCFRGVNKVSLTSTPSSLVAKAKEVCMQWRTLAAYLPTSCNHLTGLALLGTYSSCKSRIQRLAVGKKLKLRHPFQTSSARSDSATLSPSLQSSLPSRSPPTSSSSSPPTTLAGEQSSYFVAPSASSCWYPSRVSDSSRPTMRARWA